MRCLAYLVSCSKWICSNLCLLQSSSQLRAAPSFHLLKSKTSRIILDSFFFHMHTQFVSRYFSTLLSKCASHSNSQLSPRLELPLASNWIIAGVSYQALRLPVLVLLIYSTHSILSDTAKIHVPTCHFSTRNTPMASHCTHCGRSHRPTGLYIMESLGSALISHCFSCSFCSRHTGQLSGP